MRILIVAVALLAASIQPVHAQEVDAPEGATIASARVSGIETARLSPGLREAIAALAGTPLSRAALREIASRIEAEQPRYIAATRAVQDPDGAVRVVFLVARIPTADRDANVNARYTVETVELRGADEDALRPELRAELHAMEGKPLDSDEALRVEERLREALPGFHVRRRTSRGSRQGQVVLRYDVERSEASRWLHFEPLRSNLVYHSDQGWGSLLDVPLGGRDVRVTPIIAIDNGDDLVEEYSGFGLRFETRRLGSERLGASLEWSTFDQTWRDPTLAALALDPAIPGAYEQRSTITPLVTFALTPRLRVSGGVAIAELDPLPGISGSRMANAVVFSAGYGEHWRPDADAGHDVEAALTVHAGLDGLESDLEYTRYLGQGAYRYRFARHTVQLTGLAGVVTGDAPMFERFSLGDSRTLRGWNKYDIAPAGGDRVWHASIEYRYRGLALFVDSGSVWDEGGDSRVRVSSGVGFHPGPVFFTVGFPLNTDEVTAVFTMGVRFAGFGFQKY